MPILADLGLSRGRIHSLQRSFASGLRLPGTAGNYISTPDSVLNSITGDIDIRIYAKLDDWTPATAQELVAKYETSAGNQRSFELYVVNPTGNLGYRASMDGTNTAAMIVDLSSSVPTGIADGAASWIRVTHDMDNGAGQNEVKWYTSSDGITWAQLGATRTQTGVFSIFDGPAQLRLGARSTGGGVTDNFLAGTIYYAEVRNGIDGPIAARFDSSQIQVSGSLTPATINGWTWNGAALYKRDDYVRLPGTAGNYLSYPDTVANSVLGDIEFMAKLSLDDWTPAAINQIVSKGDSGGNRAYRFYVNAAGTLGLALSPDGTTGAGNELNVSSSIAPTVSDGGVLYVKATWRQSDGRVQFFTSPDGVTFPQLGTDKSLVIASIFDSTSVLEIGSRAQGVTERLAGNVYYAEVRSGTARTLVASFDARSVQTPWTVNGSGWNWEGSSFSGKPGVALQLPGTSGNYASTPDTAGNSVTGDIDIRVKAALDVWNNPATTQTFLAKEASTVLRSYRFEIQAGTSLLDLMATVDGATTLQGNSSAFVIANGATKWVRTTWTQSTHTSAFYLSDDGGVWTPLGTQASPNIASIFDSTSVLEVGSRFAGTTNNLQGKVFYAEVRNGIDGPIVAMFDPARMAKTGTRTPASTVQPGGTPNLLTPNQASFETGTTGWQDNGTANTTLAQDATQFLDGTHSLSLTAIAVGITGVRMTDVTGTVPVVAGKQYFAKCNYKAATTGRLILLRINWYQASGAFISNTAVANGADVTTGWTELSGLTTVAPPLAAFAAITATINDAAQALGEVHYLDRISFTEAPEVWTINGAAWDLVSAVQSGT